MCNNGVVVSYDLNDRFVTCLVTKNAWKHLLRNLLIAFRCVCGLNRFLLVPEFEKSNVNFWKEERISSKYREFGKSSIRKIGVKLQCLTEANPRETTFGSKNREFRKIEYSKNRDSTVLWVSKKINCASDVGTNQKFLSRTLSFD